MGLRTRSCDVETMRKDESDDDLNVGDASGDGSDVEEGAENDSEIEANADDVLSRNPSRPGRADASTSPGNSRDALRSYLVHRFNHISSYERRTRRVMTKVTS